MNGAVPSRRCKLPSAARLHQTREFQKVYRQGLRATGSLMTVVVMPQPAPRGVRLGVSVSKDHGSAVRRNKLKRLLREAFRLERSQLPPDVDVVLIPRTVEAHWILADLRAEIVHLCHKALLERRRNAPRRPAADAAQRKPQRGGKGRN